MRDLELFSKIRSHCMFFMYSLVMRVYVHEIIVTMYVATYSMQHTVFRYIDVVDQDSR